MTPALEVCNLTKSFGRGPVNDCISFKVQPGVVHAILGENGAGKSTLLKMLFGELRPDSGEVRVQGIQKSFKNSMDASKAGIGMLHQHFLQARNETALVNWVLAVGDAMGVGGVKSFFPFSKRKMLRLALEKGGDWLSEKQWLSPVSELPVGIQQRLEISKLLALDAQILLLDEPTAVLTPSEADLFLERVLELKKRGKTICIVTHKLREVLKVADSATVLRAGKNVADFEHLKGASERDLGELLVGRKLVQIGARAIARERKDELLSFKHFELKSKFSKIEKTSLEIADLNLKVGTGEIVGIGGVEGNGQNALLEFLIDPSHLASDCSGDFQCLGLNAFADTAQLREAGVGFVSSDRLQEGLVPSWDLETNFLLGKQRQKRFLKGFGGNLFGTIDFKKMREKAQPWLERLDVRPPDLSETASSLSGGNQQKWILARELENQPKLLIAAHPTRGVDIGASEKIHGEILKEAHRGSGVLLFSTELEELALLCDRVYIFYRGKAFGPFTGPDWDFTKMGQAMAGVL